MEVMLALARIIAVLVIGVAGWHRFGWLEGIAIALTVWLLMPQQRISE